MLVQDKIIQFLRVTGPVLPAKVAKNLNTDILLASAHLSDLVSQGKVKISYLKIGGSPLYYLPGQEEQLYPFAAGNVNPKDLQVLEKLREEKVMREADLELLSKVALRSLRDFAVPLQVRTLEKTELFWRWHLLSKEETEEAIRLIMKEVERAVPTVSAEIRKEESVPVPEKLPEKEISADKEEVKEEKKEEVVQPEKAVEEEKVSESEREKEEEKVEKVGLETKIEAGQKLDSEVEKKERALKEKEELVKREEQQKLSDPKVVEAKENEKEWKKVSLEEKEEGGGRDREKGESKEKKPLMKKLKDKIVKKRVLVEDTFLPRIKDFFTKLEIKIEQEENVRKNAEVDLWVEVPSVVGKMRYFCKAKKKNRCDEKDLSLAYMEAQIKKLPLLFLYSNQLSQKAEEMLESGAFENVIVKKIE